MLFATIYDKNHEILFLKLIDFRKNYIQPLKFMKKNHHRRPKECFIVALCLHITSQ